jgi:3-(methylthio)propionyl---CoA ligase
MRGLMMNDQLTLSSVIDYAALNYPTVAITSRTFDGQLFQSNWSKMAERARRFARYLIDDGVTAGDRIGTLSLNHDDHLAALFGITGVGAVCHTINPRLSVDDVAYLIDHAGDIMLLYDPAFEGLLMQAVKRLERKPKLIAFGQQNADTQAGFQAIVSVCAPLEAWPEINERQASALCYTSGTTGRPKGVLYSHRSTVLHAMSLLSANGFGIGGQDTVLPLVPLFHACAWGLPFAAAMAGSALVLPGHQMDGRSIHDLITQTGVTVAAGVPTIWSSVLDYCRQQDQSLVKLRLAATGGAAATPNLIADLEVWQGVEVYHGWGMTEVSPLGTSGRLFGDEPERARDIQTSIKLTQGHPAFGVQMRLVSDEGALVAASKSGHLQVRGLWVCSDYYQPVELGASHTADGWFQTGDIARFDDAGRLVITDRAKDVIKSGGEWISSIEIEAIAMSLPEVAQAAVIGVFDKQWDERPLLLVVLRPEQSLDLSILRAALKANLPRWQIPERIEFVEHLPLGGTGKVLKAELRRLYGNSAEVTHSH